MGGLVLFPCQQPGVPIAHWGKWPRWRVWRCFGSSCRTQVCCWKILHLPFEFSVNFHSWLKVPFALPNAAMQKGSSWLASTVIRRDWLTWIIYGQVWMASLCYGYKKDIIWLWASLSTHADKPFTIEIHKWLFQGSIMQDLAQKTATAWEVNKLFGVISCI